MNESGRSFIKMGQKLKVDDVRVERACTLAFLLTENFFKLEWTQLARLK